MGKIRRVINDKLHDLIKGQHKSRLVAFESTRLEQRPACCIAFFHCYSFSELCVYVDKIIIFLFYWNLTFVSYLA